MVKPNIPILLLSIPLIVMAVYCWTAGYPYLKLAPITTVGSSLTVLGAFVVEYEKKNKRGHG